MKIALVARYSLVASAGVATWYYQWSPQPYPEAKRTEISVDGDYRLYQLMGEATRFLRRRRWDEALLFL